MNLFASLKDNSLRRIQLSGNIQNELDSYFQSNLTDILERENVTFNGEYKVEDNQILVIEGFNLPPNYNFSNPLNIEILEPDNIDLVKSIIIKNDNYIIFQTFDNRKIIKPEKWHLVFNKDTFSKIENKGLVVDQKIDVLYSLNEKKLLFFSYHNASKIFNLSDYYREATDDEIKNFKENELFKIESKVDNSLFTSRMRKKIYLINKNNILKIVSEKKQQIKNYAVSLGISFNIDNKTNKIIFPSEKTEIEKLINFLNDDLYKSPITESLYETNSKKKLNKE